MTPAARAQAAIEILDAVIIAARDGGAAADSIVARDLKARRYAGSGDRRAIRELVYAAIRRAGERPRSGRAALLGLAQDARAMRGLFDGSPHGPAAIEAKEKPAKAGVAPAWLEAKLTAALGSDLAGLAGRAPLDLRVNSLRTTREAVLAQLPDGVATPFAEHGIRFAEAFGADKHPLFLAGEIEVQDEGSQLIAAACQARKGMTVIDLCAGAGGKTLALAADMTGEGRLFACDTDRGRLSRLPPRAERAGISNITLRLLDPGKEAAMLGDLAALADVVLIDAPCSGTGTWRRNPEARWRLTPERVQRLVEVQARLLRIGAALVKPGGRLVYAVCSLLDEEGPAQVPAFLAGEIGWRVADTGITAGRDLGIGRRMEPGRDGTDGFFVAALNAPC